MKNKKNFIFVFLLVATIVIFAMPLITGYEFVYREGTNVDLKVPCINNGSYCNPTSVCNITVIDPESSIIIDNVQMTNQTNYHNFTLNITHTATSGEYTRNVVCNDGTDKGYSSSTFLITPTGEALDVSSSISYALILAIMFGVTLFFLIFSKQTESPPIRLFFLMIGYMTMTLTVGSGIILAQNLNVQGGISNMITYMMYIVGVVLIVIMYYIFINQTKYALALWRARKGFGDMEDYKF